eukprot:CAMPEP_0114558938 /NCGR_PEP_ID=MMETSP0114-20121206/10658_1 /TAXON_ID=31324 /ORGANISM="Goniomonas sp, Strain m" /LENGTH=215 /DNA_ID=CAMNT_0001744381 /DNA_START=25 /DNA_END=672 /DNA_ORIENTATION=+
MTCAARPTFNPAQGHNEQGGGRLIAPSKQISAKDIATHTKLKYRQVGQNTGGELSHRDLKAELEERERKHYEKKKEAEPVMPEEDDQLDAEKQRKFALMDRDDVFSDDDESDEDDLDDDDEEAELLRELERIKAERAEEAAKKEREERAVQDQERNDAMLRGNPLLNSSFAVKRRWDDDVVFKNQSRGEEAPKKRFINDTIRNDFHRKFLAKYVQ